MRSLKDNSVALCQSMRHYVAALIDRNDYAEVAGYYGRDFFRQTDAAGERVVPVGAPY